MVTIAFGLDAKLNQLRLLAKGDGYFLKTADPEKVRSYILGSTTVLLKKLGKEGDLVLEDELPDQLISDLEKAEMRRRHQEISV